MRGLLIATTARDSLIAAGTILSAIAAFLALWVAVVLPKRRRQSSLCRSQCVGES
jgi:hypothetical protein